MSIGHWLCITLAIAGCSRGGGAAKPHAPAASESSETTAAVEPEPTGPYAIKVGGKYVSLDSYRFVYNSVPLVFGQLHEGQRRIVAFESLIQRELLAQAAAKLNYTVFDKSVRNSIEAGDLYLLGHKLDGKKIYFREDGAEFDPAYLEQLVVGRMGLPSIAHFQDEQRRELMAQFMRDKIEASETVSEKEAREVFVADNSKVSAEYVKFNVRYYQTQDRLSRATVQAYADANEERLRAEWHKVKPRWQSDEERIEISIVKIHRAGGPAKAARSKMQDALTKIRKGSDFATIAKAISQDRSAVLGGYVGWRGAQSIGHGQEVVTACEGLAVGKVSDVIETPSAFILVRIENRSKKGLLFKEMKLTLATRMAPRGIAREQARKAAEEALASARPLDKQFPASKPTPSNLDLPKEILDELTPDQQKALAESSVSFITDGPPSRRRVVDILRDQDFVPDLGNAKKLVKALWGKVAVGAMVPGVYEVSDGDAFVIARLTERTEADMEVFKREGGELRETLTKDKGAKAVRKWVAEACRELVASKAVAVNDEVVGLDASGKPLHYEPCAMLTE